MSKLTTTVIILTGTCLAFGLASAVENTESTPSCCVSKPSITDTNATPDILTVCPVSGETLGKMGNPYIFVYQKQEVKLCCGGCKKDFDKNPSTYLAKIRAADKK